MQGLEIGNISPVGLEPITDGRLQASLHFSDQLRVVPVVIDNSGKRALQRNRRKVLGLAARSSGHDLDMPGIMRCADIGVDAALTASWRHAKYLPSIIHGFLLLVRSPVPGCDEDGADCRCYELLAVSEKPASRLTCESSHCGGIPHSEIESSDHR